MFYLSNDLSQLPSAEFESGEIESVWIELFPKSNKRRISDDVQMLCV